MVLGPHLGGPLKSFLVLNFMDRYAWSGMAVAQEVEQITTKGLQFDPWLLLSSDKQGTERHQCVSVNERQAEKWSEVYNR